MEGEEGKRARKGWKGCENEGEEEDAEGGEGRETGKEGYKEGEVGLPTTPSRSKERRLGGFLFFLKAEGGRLLVW